MNSWEAGFLLLSSCLGNPERKPLTLPQLRTLAQRVLSAPKPEMTGDLTPEYLLSLGYGMDMAVRIISLLNEEELLHRYIIKGEKAHCSAVTRASSGYPVRLRQKLGQDSPGVLWVKGDSSLLDRPAVALVGSRELMPVNQEFAARVGEEAAKQGYVLVSGNARGADRTAQSACLEHGGSVISVVADELNNKQEKPGMLYLSLEDYDQPFTAQRALTRNFVIHALAQKTFVAQCTLEMGGTWSGSAHNLRNGWSPVFCFEDGSPAATALEQMGAERISLERLSDFETLQQNTLSLFD